MSKEYLLLNNLDNPGKVMMFSIPEFVLICSVLLTSFLVDCLGIGAAFLLIGGYLYKKFCRGLSLGAIHEMIYVHTGLNQDRLKFTLPSFMKRMIG